MTPRVYSARKPVPALSLTRRTARPGNPTQWLRGWVCFCGVLTTVLLLSLTGETLGIDTFQADILRTSVNALKKEETVAGRLFFSRSSGSLVIVVQSPIHQWVLVRDKEMFLYYPETRQAYRVLSKGDATMPFFRVVWSCLKEDFDFSKQGYTMVRHDRKGKSLLSVWKPPANLSRVLGEATLEYEDNRLTRVEHKTAKGNVLSRAVFRQHVPIAGYAFPLDVSILYGSPKGTTEERVVYTNPRFNVPLPVEIINFKIPEGVEVKDIVW
jgi:hypothetical protein